ncbi:Lactonase, 7-bladed beta-propeller-domain-containing protein [Xylaria sp. CBS 124048]|nr:Lactonase, 7-bladed beta-propeller-domain-containing protein [Xylaria sp. CBS 124048]
MLIRMARALLLMFLAVFDASVSAAKHKIIVGSFRTGFLYTLEYDDEMRSLALLAQSAVQAASSWITLNHGKSKLYSTDWAASEPTFASYAVTSHPPHIRLEKKVVGNRRCTGSKSIHVNANPQRPHAVYGTYYYGTANCATVFSVDANGTLDRVVQEYALYPPDAGIHGTAFTPDGAYLLAADTKGNRIWTHSLARESGEMALVDVIEGPVQGANPRHLAIHGTGRFVYVVLEGVSGLATYGIAQGGRLERVGPIYRLLRPGDDPAHFWADEVSLSRSNRYLWATNRACESRGKGYISVFEMAATGKIARQISLRQTDTSGGLANSVAACPFDEELAALTDSSRGFVQIWHVEEGVVAQLDIRDGGGCCANAVWLD